MRTLSSRVVHATAWLSVREDAFVRDDGATGTYTVVDKPDFALVLPCADDGFWLVEQYRYPVARRAWEFPQGGGPLTGQALAAAELAEETGLRAATWQHLGRLASAYGYSSQHFDVWLATDLVAGEPDREDSEADMVSRWASEAEVVQMVRDGRMVDAHALAALALLQLHRTG